MDHDNYIDKFKIGSVDLYDLEEINEVSLKNKIVFDKNIGSCDVYVYGNEGKIPHVHVISKNGKFETCICLNTNKHFIHGKYNDKLTNAKQRKIFDDFMGNLSKEDPTRTNWQAAGYLWNMANVNSIRVKWQNKDNKPDYRKMNDEAIKDIN